MRDRPVAIVRPTSRLFPADGPDERHAGALKALAGSIDPAIAAHGGRIVKTTGDGLLVEFASVVDACAAWSKCRRRWPTRTRRAEIDDRLPHRHQPRRHHHRRRRHLRRRRQHRRAPAGARTARRRLRVEPRARRRARPPDRAFEDRRADAKNIARPSRSGVGRGSAAAAAAAPHRRPLRCPTSLRSPCCRSRT